MSISRNKIRCITARLFITIVSTVFYIAIMSAMDGYGAEIRISSASNLSDLMKALSVEYNKKHPESSAQFIFGSSGLADKPGATVPPVDIYVTSDSAWMTFLESRNKIFPGSVATLAQSALVVIGPKDMTIESISNLSSLAHVAIANPKNSSSGHCAEQVLKAAKMYDNLVKNDNLVYTADVRQALMFTDRGETSAAIVFQTEALHTQKSAVVFTIPDKLYDKVNYPVALTSAGDKNDTARLFYSFVIGPEAADIIKKQGFTVPVREK